MPSQQPLGLSICGERKNRRTYPSKRRFISTYCGKNDYFRAVATVLRSPSPRVWGAPLAGIRWRRMGWLIPTYAGNTMICGILMRLCWAHPHVCGEHKFVSPGDEEDPGSSPRMRGTQSWWIRFFQRRGLIPTYAGNTSRNAASSAISIAHPHVCGEH